LDCIFIIGSGEDDWGWYETSIGGDRYDFSCGRTTGQYSGIGGMATNPSDPTHIFSMRVGQSPATHLIDGFSQFFGINGFEQVVDLLYLKAWIAYSS